VRAHKGVGPTDRGDDQQDRSDEAFGQKLKRSSPTPKARRPVYSGRDAYKACPISRSRRRRADIEAIKSAILQVLADDHPMTVRQVFYQLVVRGVVEKTEAEYNQAVIRLMTDMRISGDLPFEWVVDESRRRRITRTFDNITEALEHCADYYRRSALRECGDYLEIWVEKDALAAVMWDVVSEYDVPLMVSRGQPSITFLHGTALEIARAAKQGKPSYIYQFGDWDPSGVLIPQSIERRLNEMCERLGCPPPIVERVALTEKHITEFNLPTRPTKRDGNRHAKGFEGDSVELDALPPRVLRRMVKAVIERHISRRVLNLLRAGEESQRELLRAFSANVGDMT
jgi:hypothetical protein